MKSVLFAAGAACSLALILPHAFSQGKSPDQPQHLQLATDHAVANLSAFSIQRDLGEPFMVQLKGNVQIRTCCVLMTAGAAEKSDDRRSVVVRADEASFNAKTGEIDATGKVSVKFEVASTPGKKR